MFVWMQPRTTTSLQNDYPAANDWCAEALPGIINGSEASPNFLSVKQLAIANFWSHADRFAFFSFDIGNAF